VQRGKTWQIGEKVDVELEDIADLRYGWRVALSVDKLETEFSAMIANEPDVWVEKSLHESSKTVHPVKNDINILTTREI